MILTNPLSLTKPVTKSQLDGSEDESASAGSVDSVLHADIQHTTPVLRKNTQRKYAENGKSVLGEK